tara:strand:- start:730 stop:930 length:201 start_codon:yes stop_codon:yes gene_type:complete
MTDSPNDIDRARRKKRNRDGWTLDEIKRKAEHELKKYQKIAEDEPSDLASGDMDKIIKGEDDEEDK